MAAVTMRICMLTWGFARRKGLCETDARWFFKQLILALHYCHAMVRMRPGRHIRMAA